MEGKDRISSLFSQLVGGLVCVLVLVAGVIILGTIGGMWWKFVMAGWLLR